MSTYASNTEVPVEKSRMEIERTLARWNADAFGYGVEGRRACVTFRVQGRHIRIMLELPDPSAKRFTHMDTSRGSVPNWKPRTPEAARKQWDQACRSKWRALAAVIKAKLIAVKEGISTVEQEFMAHIVLPNGQTMADVYLPQIADAYATGRMPSPVAGLLPAPKEPAR